ncbi:eukaryotic phosphomannomutase [Tothia fuscella]|uniref:Phosphomannomutase n=1 Tax=Tothia fuscella TaxID=1048955 RepID=A0A9P4TU78_9PEZI|nr:eukaryotic phosphomannomutase [Tothia fuscella]
MAYPLLQDRAMKNTICLFDLDGTLCREEQVVLPEMHILLSQLRQQCAIGYVSGGPISKQQRQLSNNSVPVTSLFDFCFAENGVTAFRMGLRLPGTSLIEWIGEPHYKAFVTWVQRYIADSDLPSKRGSFVELRNGNMNVSPIGQLANYDEMDEFERYDRVHGIRSTMIEALERQFANLELQYAIGGQTCFDAFPVGWDKTYCLRHIEAEKQRSGITYNQIHFFGDKILKGQDDFELYEDRRTIGHVVVSLEDTMKQLRDLVDL